MNNSIPSVRESRLPIILSGRFLLFKINDKNPPNNEIKRVNAYTKQLYTIFIEFAI